MAKPADLIDYIFQAQPHPLSDVLLRWMENSPRFAGFVETYRDKIRKKIRTAGDPESALDVAGELEAAYCLLDDRRLSLAYEPYASLEGRGPDFAVTYRDNLVFNVEAARLRMEDEGIDGIDLARKAGRLQRMLLYKLGQMQPGMANLLLIQTSPLLVHSIDLDRLMQAVKMKAEGRDESFYASSPYQGPSAFFKDFLRLSGILLWASGRPGQECQVWANRQARPGLDEKVLRLVRMLLSSPG